MTTPTLPTHPMSLRREYLNTARKVATMHPTETDFAYLLALTEALFREIAQDPSVRLKLEFAGETA